MKEIKTDRLIHFAGWVWLLLACNLLLPGSATAQEAATHYYRADQSIFFQWRFGYSEFPFNKDFPGAREDAQRGKFGWYAGNLWSQSYRNWSDSIIQGVPLLFRGGSPYARQVKCLSEIVPYNTAGGAVSFLLPFKYTIGSEEAIAFALRIKGSAEETVVCKLRPQPLNSFTGGFCKVNFISLSVETGMANKPLITVTGLMHIRVYPQLLKYGGRTEFDFISVTHHMDVESSLVVGSLYQDMSNVDPYELAKKVQPSAGWIAAAVKQHDRQLEEWRTSTSQISSSLQQKALVEVYCQGPVQIRDKGELRVTAYSGNPVKDFQYGAPSSQMKQMAQAVTLALGRRFSVFRYQHHNLPWKMENPSELDSAELPYLRQWLEVGGRFADTVVLDLQLSPIVKLYKLYSHMGQLPLPASGIPGAEWDKIRRGYLTTIQFAKSVCPSLKIIQMPYELDNISNTAVHADAHYHFFKCLYEAVAEYNSSHTPQDQLLVAGLGSNNPNSRWQFIDGFLARYSRDRSEKKRLDYLTWHTYLFPGNYPAMIEGFTDSLKRLLKKHHIHRKIPVIVDEMGLAEPSTIEDLSDLYGAEQKEAAMAAYTATLQDYYEKEDGNYLPISGAGWHFALLTYGKQNVLSAYAKGMVLRSRLGNLRIPVKSSPVDALGFGLHAVSTKEKKKISVLLFVASPSIFYDHAAPLHYSDIDLELEDLPADFRDKRLKITQMYISTGDSLIQKILSQDKYQTLPLTRGADRYEKDFSPDEVKRLNKICEQTDIVGPQNKDLHLSVGIETYGMRLIEIEPVTDHLATNQR